MPVNRARKIERRKKLEAIGWTRIGRSEAERFPAKAIGDRLRSAIAGFKDMDSHWDLWGASLGQVNDFCGFDIEAHIRERISNLKPGKIFKVLDAGCGPGSTLAEIKKKFGNRVKTVGLTVKRSFYSSYDGVDRLITGSITEVNPREQFDFIYSFSGAHLMTELKETSIQRTIGWLKPGGTAFITLPLDRMEPDTFRNIQTTLRANGIKETGFYGIFFFFTKPERKLPR
ncbi:MAG: class I SAM-dependent methyltransferase [Candidatus Diapherotrites archaeon]|nr:class I SAM-dependent methyltransferase [Candidatus Diapherotrites archaeon]